MSNYVYLDWAATAPVHYFAKDYYIPGNPNSPHAMGLQANQALNEARQRIMDCLGIRSGKVLFCRCASEAVEWLRRRFNGLYASTLETNCSFYEHDSVFDCCYNRESDYRNILNFLAPNSIYLHQYVNQLTGTVFPIESIGKQVQSTGAFFGSDFTAGIGHYPLPNNLDSFCDAVWFSGHKFGTEPGIGAIWLSDRLFKYLGGDEDSRNEYGLLHGTPNVSSAVAMSYAMEHAVEWEKQDIETKTLHYYNLFTYLAAKLAENRIEFEVVESKDNPKSTCAINAITLYSINADSLTQYLSTKSIYISPGHSACVSNEDYRVLEAFDLTKDQASETIRVSFGEDTSIADIDALVDGIVEFKNLFI